jgi:hypothetical protein
MTLSNFTLPAVVVNKYLWHTIKQLEPSFVKTYGSNIPFFPLSDSASGAKSWENKTYVIYDRMMKYTNNPFYPIKSESLIYAVKGSEVQTLEWSMAIQYILDRQDDSAQDINNWNRSQTNPANIYFHSTRAFQSDSGAVSGLSTARDFSSRPFYITEFVIDLKYHFTDSIESYLS